MKIIIKKTGEIKEVSFGHAVNFLIPQGLAEEATDKRILELKKLRDVENKKQKTKKIAAKKKASGLTGKKIVFKLKAGKRGKIYGAITKKEIAEKLGVLKNEVILDKPIKKLGKYEVKLKITGLAKAKPGAGNPPAGGENMKIEVLITGEKE